MKRASVILAFILSVEMLMCGCKKSSQSQSPLQHTHEMAGIHNWTGWIWYFSYDGHGIDSTDSVKYIFPINVVNASEIINGFDSLHYYYHADSLPNLHDSGLLYYPIISGMINEIFYDYYTNIIYYAKIIDSSKGKGQIQMYLHTYN